MFAGGFRVSSNSCSPSELDMERELAALDVQRALVVRASLRAALTLADLPTACLESVRLFSAGVPVQAVGGNSRPGYTIAGPNQGSYTHDVLAAEWAAVGLVREDLALQGRALALPLGLGQGGPDVEEEVLEEDAGEAEAQGAEGS
jgi:hypothetical protein